MLNKNLQIEKTFNVKKIIKMYYAKVKIIKMYSNYAWVKIIKMYSNYVQIV